MFRNCFNLVSTTLSRGLSRASPSTRIQGWSNQRSQWLMSSHFADQQIKINITMHRVLKNLAMSLQILNLDSLKILLSKYLQHGPLQDRHISKAREAPSVSGDIILVCRWQGFQRHGPEGMAYMQRILLLPDLLLPLSSIETQYLTISCFLVGKYIN